MKRPARPRSKTRLRYDAASAYVRGTETRARLIEAGLALFGSRGFDGASTRDIAAAAGLNAPSLQYYFDSKEGLYLACARCVVARIWDGVGGLVLAGERLLRADASDGALIGAFCDIQVRLLDILHGVDENWYLLVAREHAGIGPATGYRVVHRGTRRILQVQAAILGRLSGAAIGDPECRIRVLCLHAQVLFFRTLRRGLSRSRRVRHVDSGTATPERVIREQSAAALRVLIAARRRRALAHGASDSH
jgi:AcrR family transcriptional regulator